MGNVAVGISLLLGLLVVVLLHQLWLHLQLKQLLDAPPPAPDPRLDELAAVLRRIDGKLTAPAAEPVDTAELRAALAALDPTATPPLKAGPAELAHLIRVASERPAPDPEPDVPAPARTRQGDDLAAPAAPDTPETRLDALLDQASSPTLPLVATLKSVRDLPKSILTAIERGEVHEMVVARQAELDQALYGRVAAEALQEAFGDRLEPGEAERLAQWLREHQQTAVRELEAAGLKRIPASPGSLFEEGRILPDPNLPPLRTHRQELAQRVAGVEPGQGGYEYRGEVVCPTRAQAYEYESSGGGGGSNP